jgi:hypothetical protein
MNAVMYNHMSLVQFKESTSEVTYLTYRGELSKTTMPGLTHADIQKWINGELIQNAMPYLTADQREILLTGLDQTSWDNLFSDEDEDDE